MTKIFAHRGFVTQKVKEKIGENSVASLHEARKHNFSGVEFDVWFIGNSLLLHHDMPQQKEVLNLPLFQDYLVFKNDFEYWIDFKNLNESNAVAVAELITKEIKAAKIDVKKVFFAPFITDLNKAIPVYDALRNSIEGAQIMAVCEDLAPQDFANYYQNLQKNHIKFLSIKHEIIDENFAKIFSDITLFAWTVNDLARLCALQKMGVKNFTSDIITPKML